MKFKSELILQRNTRNNLELFDLELVAFEFQYDGKRFDTLAFDNKDNSFVIIEYKIKYDSDVLKQCKSYYNLLLDNKEIYIDKYNEVFKTDLCEDDFNFDNTRVFIIGPDFSDEQIDASKSPHYPFEIWKVTLNENNCISYENVVTNEVKKLEASEDDLKFTEKDLLQNRSQEMIDFYNALKNTVLNEFSDVCQRISIDAFSFKINNKIVCRMRFLDNSLNAFFFIKELDDKDNKLEDISNKKSEGNAHYKLNLKPEEDLDYFLDLFRQTYDQKVFE